jgi:hypothetical protein
MERGEYASGQAGETRARAGRVGEKRAGLGERASAEVSTWGAGVRGAFSWRALYN